MSQIIGMIEDKPGEEDEETYHGESILHRGIGREGDSILGEAFHLDACRVVLADDMQGPDM